MAEKIINEKIDSIFCELEAIKKLNEIINNRFAYQRVLVICDDSRNMLKLKSFTEKMNYKIDICNISGIDYENEFDLYVAWGSDECVNRVKALAYLKNTQYIIIASNNNSLSIFSNTVFAGVTKKQVNYPLVILFDLENIYKFGNEFICSKLMELSILEEYKLEQRLNKHIYELDMDRNFFDEANSILGKMFDLKRLYVQSKNKAVDEMINLFIETGLLLIKFNQNLSIVEIMGMFIHKRSKLSFSESKFISSQILLKVYMKFIETFKMNCKHPISYEKHQKILQKYNIVYTPTQEYDVKKFDYIIKNYKDRLQEYILLSQNTYEVILELCKYFSLNFLFHYSEKLKTDNYVQALSLASDLYSNNSLLKIINSYGFLNYSL